MAFRNCCFSLQSTIIFFFLLLSLFHVQFSTAVKGGYFTPYNGVQFSDIDSTLFTHLFCAFAHLDTQTYQVTIEAGGCLSFPQAVKRKNPSVKALISIGGGRSTPADFNNMASNPSTRKTFIDSSIKLAKSNGFDGLDLDWEQQSSAKEMSNLAALLTEWRAAINASSSSQPLLLTAALRYTATAGGGTPFPAKAISDSLDWANLMAYDLYGPGWSPKPEVTRPHSALRDPSGRPSGSVGVNAWIKAGVPANKLVLGFPFYGYAWKLSNANDNGILAPSSGNDTSVGDGVPTYKQIKDFISQTGATVKYNSSYVTNYCYSGTTWVTYDDTESITQKVLYAKNSASLLGYFAWNIVQDSDWILSKQASQTWGV